MGMAITTALVYTTHPGREVSSSRGRLGSRPCSSKVNVHHDAGPTGGRVPALYNDIIGLCLLLDVCQAASSRSAHRLTCHYQHAPLFSITTTSVSNQPLIYDCPTTTTSQYSHEYGWNCAPVSWSFDQRPCHACCAMLAH